jgi:hypothetical protein
MKNVISTALIAVLFAAGCSKSKPAVTPDPEPRPAGGAIACEAELALACAEGEADGCLDARTLFHACVPAGETAGPPCEQEIAKVCPDGQIDACLATPPLASTHLCVVTAAAPVANACPDGQAFYAPGCGSEQTKLDAAGCYASCAAGAACAAGFTCKAVTTNPCHDSTCDACGAESQLCIPAA